MKVTVFDQLKEGSTCWYYKPSEYTQTRFYWWQKGTVIKKLKTVVHINFNKGGVKKARVIIFDKAHANLLLKKRKPKEAK